MLINLLFLIGCSETYIFHKSVEKAQELTNVSAYLWRFLNNL